MSVPADAIQGMQTVLNARITGMHAYDWPPDAINEFPAAVITHEAIEPELAIAGNSFEGFLRVIYLTEMAHDRSGYLRVYDAMDSTGSGVSVVAAIRADATLDSKVDFAEVTRIENIGRRQYGEGQPVIGFDVLVRYVKTVA